MLTPEQRAAVDDAVHAVMNRESDHEVILAEGTRKPVVIISRAEGGFVGNSINVLFIEGPGWNLEPLPEDMPPLDGCKLRHQSLYDCRAHGEH